MLKDQRAAGMWTDFFTDWLDADNLATAPKDTGVYPMFNDALTTAMTGELQGFVTAVTMTGSGRLDDLLTGTSSFANQPLASLYGISGVTGTALKPVMLDPAQRAGILTTAAFLHAMNDRCELRHDSRIQRLFGFFQKQERVLLEERPHQPNQPQCPIGELILSLPAGIWAPVRVNRLEMRTPGIRISEEFELFELRDSDLQRFFDQA